MTQKELAALLGISGAAVSKLVKRGMPTDSLERAKRWRKRHLEPGRIKGGKFDPNAPHLVAAATAEAERLASVVLQSLDGMGSAADGERILAPLRSALRVASPEGGGPVMPSSVWVELLRYAVSDTLLRVLASAGGAHTSASIGDLTPVAPAVWAWPDDHALELACDRHGHALTDWEACATE